jgi:hypothetical protein
LTGPPPLQQHDPGGSTHQKRGPERHQHQDHQEIADPRRQRGKLVGERIAKDEAERGDHEGDPERAREDIEVDRLLRRRAYDPAGGILLAVQSGQNVERRPGGRSALDDGPGGGLGPARIEPDQSLAPGACGLVGKIAPGRQQQTAKSGQVVGKPLGRDREHACVIRLPQLGRKAGEGLLVGQAFAVPFPDPRRGLRHDRAQLGIVDAAHEHAGDRHEEEHQQEQE